MSLRLIIFLGLLLLGLTPVMLHVAIQAPGIHNMLKVSTERDATERAELEISDVNARMDQRIDMVRTLSILPVYPELIGAGKEERVHSLSRDMAMNRYAQVMTRWFSPHDDVLEVHILDIEGVEKTRLLRSNDGKFQPVVRAETINRNDHPCYQRALQAAGRVSASIIDTNSKRPCFPVEQGPILQLSKLLSTPKGQDIGVLAVGINLSKLLAPGSTSYWVRFDGSYLSGPVGPISTSSFTDFPGLKEIMAARQYPKITSSPDHGMFVWQPLLFGGQAESTLWIGSPVDRSIVTRWLEQFTAHLFIWTGIMIAIVAVLAHLLARAADTFRHQLLDSVQSILTGRTTVPFRWRKTRELRSLGHDLDELAQKYKKLEQARQTAENELRAESDRVTALNETLEHKVDERTEQLHHTNEELEAFSYSASHDLRKPLRAISGFSGALLEDYSSLLDDEGQDLLRRVMANTRYMDELIDDLLSLSHLSRHKIRLEPVDMTSMANKILTELKMQETGRDVVIKVEKVPVIPADDNLIHIALQNIIGNAWKYTRDQHPASIEFGSDKLKGKLTFFVRDNGTGFDMRYADRLFAPFQRLHKKDEYEGSGIGLATVKRIIDRHGGHVWAESGVGQGTTLFFTLPENPLNHVKDLL